MASVTGWAGFAQGMWSTDNIFDFAVITLVIEEQGLEPKIFKISVYNFSATSNLFQILYFDSEEMDEYLLPFEKRTYFHLSAYI